MGPAMQNTLETLFAMFLISSLDFHIYVLCTTACSYPAFSTENLLMDRLLQAPQPSNWTETLPLLPNRLTKMIQDFVRVL